MNIKLYTDGACSGNPGPGGYGFILSTVLPNGETYEVKHSGGYRLTTNNRMELASIIYGLVHVNGSHNIEVISDSKYVCDPFNQHWIENWRKNGWKKSNGETVSNKDMWITLWNLVSMQNHVKFTWIKGHDTNEYNNECDRLAVAARQDTENLDIDDNYESGRCLI
jgi:ribonuclease HI